MSTLDTNRRFLDFLLAQGYRLPREIPGGRYACIQRKMFTTAIITGRMGDEIAIGDCWCYRTPEEAVKALLAWDGIGEPVGWIRHPDTGRRIATEPGQIDDDGKVVPLGKMYIRR